MKIQSIKTQDNKEIMLIELEGRLDNVLANEFEEKVFHFIDQGYYNLLINLKQISYLGSSGIRILLAANSKVKENNGKLAISNMPSTGLKILKAMEIINTFNLFDNEIDALKKF